MCAVLLLVFGDLLGKDEAVVGAEAAGGKYEEGRDEDIPQYVELSAAGVLDDAEDFFYQEVQKSYGFQNKESAPV